MAARALLDDGTSRAPLPLHEPLHLVPDDDGRLVWMRRLVFPLALATVRLDEGLDRHFVSTLFPRGAPMLSHSHADPVRLNGQSLDEEPRALDDGDVLSLGRDRVTFRLVEDDSRIVFARRIGPWFAFNPGADHVAHAWRAVPFDVDARARDIGLVIERRDGAQRYPDRCGVPLSSILQKTRAQGALLDSNVVARIFAGRVLAGYLGDATRVIVGWDGGLPASTDPRAGEANARLVAKLWPLLTGEPAPFDEEHAMKDPRAVDRFVMRHAIDDVTPTYLAGLVQRLFPGAWDEERMLREEVALLDGDAMARLTLSASEP
jgi:hypothetical protein